MYRQLTAFALFVSISAIAAETKIYADTNDSAKIYTSFIDDWTGKQKDPINIAIKADAPTEDELKEFSECSGNSNWGSVEQINDLTGLIGSLSYVHLVDPNNWSPNDPEKLIANGQSVDTAVKNSFNSGLGSFSAIAFNKSHTLAAFSFSFVCGSLCGNGRIVIFKRTSTGWVQADKQCGGWVS